MAEVFTNDQAKTAAQHRADLADEYSQYTANEPIYIDGALAFAPGSPVPKSHIEKYPELRDAVDERAATEPPRKTAKREVWAAYATNMGAPAEETADPADGGLAREELIAKYGPQEN